MRNLTSALLFLITAGAGPGCSILIDPDTSSLYPRRDSGTVDAGSQPDANTDGVMSMFDAHLSETGVPDAGDPLDSGPPDAGSPDSGTEDAGTDAGVFPIGCDDGTVEQPYAGHPDMVGCDGALNQCDAHVLCGVGWHLCAWDEFLARGADVTATTIRWIAGCVRSFCSLDPMAVSPDICGDCTSGESMLPLAVSFACGAGRPTTEIACDVGVTAYTNPIGRRIATSATRCLQAEAFPTREAYGATCCR